MSRYSRDLKPQNLLLENKVDMDIKVIDFGTSAIFSKDFKFNEIIGTVRSAPNYD
jgi:serine/threonine protein kinase